MRAHQRVPALPVERSFHPLADGRTVAVGEHVPHGVALLAHVHHGDASEHAGVVGLPAARRIEGRPVERDPIAVNGGDHGVEAPQRGLPEVEQLGPHGTQCGGGSRSRAPAWS